MRATIQPLYDTATAPDDRVVAWRNGQPITRVGLAGDVLNLAADLPERAHVVNYCADRYHFMTGLLAAAQRKQVTLLANDKTPAALSALANRFDGLYALSDQPLPDNLVDVHDVRSGATVSTAPADMPGIDADQVVAQVFTSGTTGQPQGHSKTWGSLVNSGRLLMRRFEPHAGETASIVATVPPQHMYGLEASIMLPLAGDAAVHGGHPFYPADIVAALMEVPPPRLLVTTPVHLRAIVEERGRFPALAMAVSATDHLPDDLARRAEAKLGAPVCEIFGCTEAGSLAFRHTMRDESWQLLDGFALHVTDGEGVLTGAYLDEPLVLSDVVEPVGSDGFRLLGRTAEMVKVAGKRASLAGLNAVLTDIDGVEDGVFVPPPDDGSGRPQRLLAVVVAPRRAVRDIKRELGRRLDAAFVPRRIVKVAALPRNSTGKLPAKDLAALLERGGDRRPG